MNVKKELEALKIISLREHPERLAQITAYIQQAWSEMPPIMYEHALKHSITATGALPQWYVLEKESEPIGCAGLIYNDFNSRTDLYPWLCALHISEAHRGNAYGAYLMDKLAVEAKRLGFENLYLCTDHVGYYEQYGYQYIGQTYHPWDEETRVYALHLAD